MEQEHRAIGDDAEGEWNGLWSTPIIRPRMSKGCWFLAAIVSSGAGQLRGDQKAGGRQ